MNKFILVKPVLIVFAILAASCSVQTQSVLPAETSIESLPKNIRLIIESAKQQTKITTGYTQKYFAIDYPGGDVPKETGACTDVVIRAFRNAGVDLQKAVHEDMKVNFRSYPQKWGLSSTDTNIDHRRVPNLRRFFERKGKSLGVSGQASDYEPGDVVTWDLNGKGLTHIGIVSERRDPETGRPFIYHNIGSGTRLEDRLFEWEITGRYRYFED
ncbi:MAG: DUF1287 domain-containing protein [Acidobacteria bacterium]|nr:MAG: DUF1287 domain-containing protein [Acidobacteriota bacterium]REJ99361.1 MAG: DUF1287 domain-containing protein [Acidobacteriota bacterium]REK16469.1 MAG: DUF1287 domain-containing protein [Acidobacteriota bacterium]REK44151.1 MAG: DUF1287 domain-containing protein [Acidobacteriota bacterium]